MLRRRSVCAAGPSWRTLFPDASCEAVPQRSCARALSAVPLALIQRAMAAGSPANPGPESSMFSVGIMGQGFGGLGTGP
eukprot:13026061-Alexandrium_andersonii.AAC.1